MPERSGKVTALAGGIGAAKLLWGLARKMPAEDLTIIVNTGDDTEIHGFTVCPDLDTVTYTLAGIVNPATGWGVSGDTFTTLEWLRRYGRETWFQLGDRDLALHIHRTTMLREGAPLSSVADSIRRALEVRCAILPMSDQKVRTFLETGSGWLAFQEYFVRDRAQPPIRRIRFEGAGAARPAPGVVEAIEAAGTIVVCPSNPLISIGPILAIPGIENSLIRRRAEVIAVTPLVSGKALKGPTDKMMSELGMEVTAYGVARHYHKFAGTFILDEADKALSGDIAALDMHVITAPTVMRDDAAKDRLAEIVLAAGANR